ncbi:phosphoglycerate dehydrogenase [Candidatus Daviesbacteria bacterium]|nr:phosphoglycerate dehydrogenase [Candidatus Daviesbacteria bacterium]
MSDEKFFIIDFDSTFVTTEGLEVLAEVALEDNPEKDGILDRIKQITSLGMEGKIEFVESLTKRLALIKANKSHLKGVTKTLRKKISPSVLRNKQFFKTYKDQIYIISGGFKEFIEPIVFQFGIAESHILANEFLFDRSGNITGFSKNNIMGHPRGKVEAVKALKLSGQIIVIGDGYTDYQLREMGIAHKFIAFTENIERDIVTKKADAVVPSFDEFLYINKLPMSISYPKNRIKVLLLENIDKSAVAYFKDEGYSVEHLKTSLDESELMEKIKDIYILGVRSKTKVTKKVLDNAPRLLTIGSFSVGTDNVDLSTAADKGITVFNAPYQNTRSVVELVIGEIIMLARRVFEKSTKLHAGIWDKSVDRCFEVRGKTLGIIGYGNIGMQIGVLAESLGIGVYFYDVVQKLAVGNAKRCKNLDELFKKADIITIHVDGNKRNTNLITAKEFKKMKDGVIFVNLSRGFIVDIEDLAEAVRSGKVGGAAVDVFPVEPKASHSTSSGQAGDKFSSKLQDLPNVILTPHVGGNTIEAQASIAEYISHKLIEFVNSGNTYLSVNIPNIQPMEKKDNHRLLHIHKNVPGILAKINSILAEENINILGQYLKTNESVGYVITDVDKKYGEDVIKKLKQIPDTIRFRVLY